MKKIQLGGHRYKNCPVQGYALVDNEDFVELNKYTWCIQSGYAYRRCKKSETVFMHKLIMKTPKGMDTDHINGNGLDNRKENLRICTHAQNLMNQRKRKNNTSGYKGVCWSKDSKKWMAKIMLNYKSIYLGLFTHKKDASVAYNEAAKKYYKKFASLNEYKNI